MRLVIRRRDEVFVLVLSLLFGLFWIPGWTEFRYLLFEKQTTGTVIRYLDGRESWSLAYSFTDVDGTVREGHDRGEHKGGPVPEGSPPGTPIKISFIPNTNESRPAKYRWRIVFVPCVISAVSFAWVMWRWIRPGKGLAIEQLRVSV